jgi:murein DD-endopeptidase MepM/ murein hydrolase activator NlpD
MPKTPGGAQIMLQRSLACLAMLLLTACGAVELSQGTPGTTATPRPTRTPTPRPSPTPTPTATALPAVITGDPRALTLAEPVRQSSAPCGFVDTFDFPLDPPDAEAASGGSDFALYRERYDGFHAGEDWRFGRLTSFGQPVYSVAHGRVTYAQPLGWGADKGVVIVEHTFRSGRRVLSFYGHLDPPSVTLRAGQCVQRGDQVGSIGDPRTSPHLHFEIRVHLPDTPGPGYWPSDPRRRGWRPPSATIWFERMAGMPGARWGLLRDDVTLVPLGQAEGVELVSAGDQVQALDPADGRTRWSLSLPESAGAIVLDAGGTQLYSGDSAGLLEAYAVTAPRAGEPTAPLWQVDLGQIGTPELAPLPGGGVLVIGPTRMLAISLEGRVLWSRASARGIVDWAQVDSTLVGLARDRIWLIGEEGATSWPVAFAGHRIVASGVPLVHAGDGLYLLDLAAHTTELVYALPSSRSRSGGLVELRGGGHLLVHTDAADTRLIAIEADGSLRWERSLRALGARSLDVQRVGENAYLIAVLTRGSSTSIDILRVSDSDGALTRIFSGGTRSSSGAVVTFASRGASALISIPGVGLLAWDPLAALQAVSGQ